MSFENDPAGREPAEEGLGGPAPGFTPGPPAGNRPADNARRATPEDRVEETWYPQEGATDFLGLDADPASAEGEAVEIRLPEAMRTSGGLEAPVPQPAFPAATASPPSPQQRGSDGLASGAGASWLLELDEDARAAAEARAAEAELEVPEQLEDSWSEATAPTGGLRKALVGGMAAVVVGALGLTIYRTLTVPSQPAETASSGPVMPPPVRPPAEVELHLPGDPTAGSERGPADGSAPARREPIGATGSGTPGRAPTPAVATAPAEPVAPVTEPVATEPVATETAPTDPMAAAPASTEPVAAEPAPTDPMVAAPASTEPVAAEPAPTDPMVAAPASTEPVATEPAPVGPELVGPVQPGAGPVASGPSGPAERLRARGLDPAVATGPFGAFLRGLSALGATPFGSLELTGSGPVAATEPEPAEAAPFDPLAEGSATRTARVTDPALAALPPLPASVRLATASELSNVWPGEAVPVEAIARGEKLLTPWVGRVRAVLHNGEIFEGRLYAVGQRRVWLTTGIGRMALAEHQVARIDQLASSGGASTLGSAGSYDLVGLPRVRVRTPGGVFYGKVVAQDEASVTLITDEGARIKLPGDDVQPASDTRTIVRSTARMDEAP